MRPLNRYQALCGLIIFISASVAAIEKPSDPRQVVASMIQAMNTLNYQGTVALLRNGKLETMKLTHAFKDGVEQERLSALNSPLREIIRDGDKVLCVFQQSNKLVIDHQPSRRSFFLDMPEDVKVLDEYYKFTFNGEGKVAMRPTKVVFIRPKDQFRYTRKIWIDQESFLPLKFEMLDNSGAVLEQSVFIDVRIEDTLPILEIATDDFDNIEHVHKLDRLPFTNANFILENIPAGFHKVFFAHRKMRDSDQPVEHLLISDGFSSISVYFEKGAQNPKSNLITAGAIHSYDRQLNDFRITVMGEVPARTVRFIADGIKLR